MAVEVTGRAADPAEADEAANADGAPRAGHALGYRPGLDGLRGLAVLAIFAFHAGFTWAPGAFLSVSTFFTLSGFLITFLLLAEHERAGRVDRRAFWVRRAKRLLPASLAVITAVVLAAAAVADADQLARLPGDVGACLAYVANWRFIALGDSYGALFQSESPLQHFWSLAIEEQFYLLYPLVFVGLLALARGSRKVLAIGLGVLAGASLLTSLLLQVGGATTDRLYFGTDVRAAELLVGALLAVWWSSHRHVGVEVGRRTVRISGSVALLLMLVLWAVARQGDRGWYQGGLLAYSVVTALVVLAAVQTDGPVHRILSWRPLVALGVISYGAYLIHWPVFVWLDERTGLAPWPLFVVRVAITIGLAVLLYRVVELPVRRGGTVLVRRGAIVVPTAVVAIVLLAVAVGGLDRAPQYDFEAAKAQLSTSTSTRPTGTVPTISLYGDSTALMTGLGLTGWAQQHPDVLHAAGGFVELGCGTVEGWRHAGGTDVVYPEKCRGWVATWARTAAAERPDIAVVQLGPWEVADTQIPGDEPFRSLGDPVLDTAVRGQLTGGVDALRASGATVVLLTGPYIEAGRREGAAPPAPLPESDPARTDRWNQIVREVAASRDGVGVVDLNAYVSRRGADDRRLRPDGIHFTWDTANEVAEWLGPEIARVGNELRSPATTSTSSGGHARTPP